MRCKPPIRYVLMKILEHRTPPVEFYGLREESGTFRLHKDGPLSLDDEAFIRFPESHLSNLEGFEDLSVAQCSSGRE